MITKTAIVPLVPRAFRSPEIFRAVPVRSPCAIHALEPYQPTAKLAATTIATYKAVEWVMRPIMAALLVPECGNKKILVISRHVMRRNDQDLCCSAARSAASLAVRLVKGDGHRRDGLVAEALLDRVKDRQALGYQAGGDLAQTVGAVQNVQIRAGQPGRGFLDNLRQLLDQHPVKRDLVVRGSGLGLQRDSLRVRPREDLDLLGFGPGGLDDLADQLLLAQLGLPLGKLSLRREHFHRRLGLGERAGLGRLCLCPVYLGLVLRLDDRGLPGVLGLGSLRLLLRLGGSLVGLSLGDLCHFTL